jgi:inhibitor of cysteine peptidase
VTDAGDQPIAGVTIWATGGFSATTDALGQYTLDYLPPGSYTLTPTLDGYSFDPATRTVDVPPDATDQDFHGVTAPFRAYMPLVLRGH